MRLSFLLSTCFWLVHRHQDSSAFPACLADHSLKQVASDLLNALVRALLSDSMPCRIDMPRRAGDAVSASFRSFLLLWLKQTPGKHSVYEVNGKPNALQECSTDAKYERELPFRVVSRSLRRLRCNSATISRPLLNQIAGNH